DPNNPLGLSIMAGELLGRGDIEQGLEFHRRAVAADPLHITNLGNMSIYLRMTGRLDEAEFYALKAMEVAPTSAIGAASLGYVRLLQGRAQEALDLVSAFPEERPGVQGDGYLFMVAMARHTLGDARGSDGALETYRDRYAADFPMHIAYLHAWRGEADLAFKWLDEAMAQDGGDIEVLSFMDPFLFSLHGDPRWQAITARWPEVDEWPEPPAP
ncbi:MAG: hypothetical protein GTN86_04675, partial [Xanthomonadales bacterium]|nr:hypothetical protein [Xanthomonadales bacterium]NIN59317.1 hypothetical protein [Xanthomonadales bacterium]NIN74621.1 hypothetical protein [Xanthomonadales bacterium]NIO12571.1 hypothetical protein [Xanthomonadales bacterium]NIP11710.1 hypothetical protein [Xanthomonadales bacterium]